MLFKQQEEKMDKLTLINTEIFAGISEIEIDKALECLNAIERKYKKGDIVLKSGTTTKHIGLILRGSVNIVVNYYWGASNIYGHISQGDIFAETYAILPNKELVCDVIASEDSNILFLNLNNILKTCDSNCSFHNQIISNIMKITAKKNFYLSTRMMHTAPKSIRIKLLSYFSEQSLEKNSNEFEIPFSRQELADYLGVDRSALSKELSKMQKEGLIFYKKNKFKLYSKQHSM